MNAPCIVLVLKGLGDVGYLRQQLHYDRYTGDSTVTVNQHSHYMLSTVIVTMTATVMLLTTH